MHEQQVFFVNSVRRNLPEWFQHKRVLEVGSLDVNGSIRPLFDPNCTYLGIDIGPGRGVDLVVAGEDYAAPDATYDVVISCEMMEHNPKWRDTWLNMLRVLKPTGLMLMTCASYGRVRHGATGFSPQDSPLTAARRDGSAGYYRNLVAEDFTGLMRLNDRFHTWQFFTDHASHDLYFIGVGPDASTETTDRVLGLCTRLSDYYQQKAITGI